MLRINIILEIMYDQYHSTVSHQIIIVCFVFFYWALYKCSNTWMSLAVWWKIYYYMMSVVYFFSLLYTKYVWNCQIYGIRSFFLLMIVIARLKKYRSTFQREALRKSNEINTNSKQYSFCEVLFFLNMFHYVHWGFIELMS